MFPLVLSDSVHFSLILQSILETRVGNVRYFYLQHLFVWKYWITGVVSAMVIALGFVGNLTAIFILRKPKMSTAFNQLLIVLCVFDTIFLVMNIPTTELAFQSRKYPLIFHFFPAASKYRFREKRSTNSFVSDFIPDNKCFSYS